MSLTTPHPRPKTAYIAEARHEQFGWASPTNRFTALSRILGQFRPATRGIVLMKDPSHAHKGLRIMSSTIACAGTAADYGGGANATGLDGS